jgi:hypothetical protein
MLLSTSVTKESRNMIVISVSVVPEDAKRGPLARPPFTFVLAGALTAPRCIVIA